MERIGSTHPTAGTQPERRGSSGLAPRLLRWLAPVVAAVLVVQVLAAGCVLSPDAPINGSWGNSFRNDSDSSYILRTDIYLHGPRGVVEAFLAWVAVPADSSGSVTGGGGDWNQPGSTAVLFTADCRRVASFDIAGTHTARRVIHIDAAGHAEAIDPGAESLLPQPGPTNVPRTDVVPCDGSPGLVLPTATKTKR